MNRLAIASCDVAFFLRTRRVQIALVFLASLNATASCLGIEATTRPNVVLVYADDKY